MTDDTAVVTIAGELHLGTVAEWEGRVSRNAPCPCGSGQKYKHCHGQVAAMG